MERMIHVACDDLFFRAKIEATAQAADVDVVFVDSVDEIKGGGLLLVDLNYNAIDPIDAIRRLKSSSATMLVVAFGSHTDRKGLEGAIVAGADQVMARSTFVERLPVLLQEQV
jgi:DNA-binding NarL/FixJ family response regulator